MPPRRKAAEELTDREVEILKAAAVIFQEKGFAVTGTEDVEESAGASPARLRRKAAATMRRRRQPAEELPDREAEILKAAAEVFREKGYAATSTQDIADRVGMYKGSLYYYIDSKEDLLYRIGRSVYAELKREQDLAAEPDAQPLERLRAFVRTHVLHTTSNLAEAAAFYGDFRSFTGERRADIVRWRDEYEAAFRSISGISPAAGGRHGRSPTPSPTSSSRLSRRLPADRGRPAKPGRAVPRAGVGVHSGDGALRHRPLRWYELLRLHRAEQADHVLGRSHRLTPQAMASHPPRGDLSAVHRSEPSVFGGGEFGSLARHRMDEQALTT
jgi:AcrR family transcriptional regulator